MRQVDYNFDPKESGAATTRMEMPLWSKRVIRMGRGAHSRFRKSLSNRLLNSTTIRNVSTSKTGDFNEDGIMQSDHHDEPATLDSGAQMNWAREMAPVEDEPDVMDWMVPATVHNAHMRARSLEYKRAGSDMAAATGDAYIPGVSVDNVAFATQQGSAVASSGEATLQTPDGDIGVPVPGETTVVTPNMLGWAAAPTSWNIQWTGVIQKVRELTTNPSSTIGFPNVQGLTGPVFASHEPGRSALRNDVTVKFNSNTAQTVTFTYMDPDDYTSEITSIDINIPKGQSTTTFRILGVGLPPMAVEMSPENQTQLQLEDYSVAP